MEEDKFELTGIVVNGITYEVVLAGASCPCDECALSELCKDSGHLGYFCNEMLGENKCFGEI